VLSFPYLTAPRFGFANFTKREKKKKKRAGSDGLQQTNPAIPSHEILA
jgi:hypothetical protein